MASILRYFRLTARSRRAYAVYVQGQSGPTLSTSEFDTGKRDTSGNVIYGKLFNVANLPNAATLNITHNVTFTRVWGLWGTATNGTSHRPMPNPGANPIELACNATQIQIVTSTNFSTWSGFVVLEYVK